MELTVEQLLEIVAKDGRSLSNLTDDNSNVGNFVREHGVKDGPALIPNYVVYFTYCRKWKPTGQKLSKIGFLRKFSIAFESKRTKSTRYYLLTEEAFDISEEALNEARQFDKRYRTKASKKAKQKKQGEVSSTST